MIRGLYSAASALNAATMNQELVAENLANVNMPGYRRSGLLFESLLPASTQPTSTASDNLGGIQSAKSFTNFETGPIQHTGNPLDLALSSNVYFVIDGPDGPVYTRNGSFQRGPQGDLQTVSGLPVRSNGGKLTIPAEAAQINITKEGVVKADENEVGRLQLAEFKDPSGLQRVGSTLFEGPQGPAPAPGTYTVDQGYREGSNVKVVNEMVSMLTGMRFYEAAERAIRALGDVVSLSTKPQ
jgi:flagellar basal body rod protein FlgG